MDEIPIFAKPSVHRIILDPLDAPLRRFTAKRTAGPNAVCPDSSIEYKCFNKISNVSLIGFLIMSMFFWPCVRIYCPSLRLFPLIFATACVPSPIPCTSLLNVTNPILLKIKKLIIS